MSAAADGKLNKRYARSASLTRECASVLFYARLAGVRKLKEQGTVGKRGRGTALYYKVH